MEETPKRTKQAIEKLAFFGAGRSAKCVPEFSTTNPPGQIQGFIPPTP
jgi:hypothetical protein